MRCNCVSNFTWHNIAKLYKNQKKISLKFHSHTIWCFLPACLFYDVSDGTFSTDTENKKKPTASYCVRFCPPQKLSHRWEIFFWADLFLESWITALESQPSWLLLRYVVYTQQYFCFLVVWDSSELYTIYVSLRGWKAKEMGLRLGTSPIRDKPETRSVLFSFIFSWNKVTYMF
jgi:hypothetical protein